jgi:two-component system sensor histidine kinase CpxA
MDAAAARRDEIGDLAREFRSMAARLQSSMAGRQRLLRDMSHELRSPLARLQAAIELADREAGPGHHPDFARMENECRRLDTMIGDVLALSRAEQDEAALATQSFDLAATVLALVADARFEGQPQDKRILLESVEHLLYAGNERLLASAIENVLRNAVRYTPPAGTVTVVLQRRGDRLELSIDDTGPGVPAVELEKIFEPFYRVSEARERGEGGSGVGLAIAARVIRRHRGTICARNGASGGLEVVMSLPAGAAGSMSI